METRSFYLAIVLVLVTIGTALSQDSRGRIARRCNDCFPGGGGGDGGLGTLPDCSIFPSAGVLYVDQSKAISGNGTSWAQAVKSLSEAVQYANDCDKVKEIRVASGTYKPSTTANTASRKHTFFIGRGYKLIGGYPSGGGAYDPASNPTILDGDLGAGYRSYHVLVIVATSWLEPVIVEGFRVRNGASDGIGSIDVEGDLGVWPVFDNSGSGAYIYRAANVTFRNCAIYDNGNFNVAKGGAFYCNSSSVKLVNCVVEGNRSNLGGGILSEGLSTNVHAINSTFYGNMAPAGNGGASYNHLTTTMRFTNSIVWGNSSAWDGSGTPSAEYSILQEEIEGVGNQNIDPKFSDPLDPNGVDNKWFTDDDGLSLSMCSPSVNRGSNEAVNGLSLEKDITGADRIHNMTIDAGAYEYHVIPRPSGGQSLVGLAEAGIPVRSFVYDGATALNYDCMFLATITPTGSSGVSGAFNAEVHNYLVDFPEYQNTKYVRRHYHLHPENNADQANAFITLYFTQAEFDAYNTEVGSKKQQLPKNSSDELGKSSLRITQFYGNPESHSGRLPAAYTEGYQVINPKDDDITWHPGRGAVPGDPAQGYWSVTFHVGRFSGFFVSAGDGGSLPVNFSSFDAQTENSAVQLSWTTTVESNSRHFLVQRSTDALKFTEIGTVAAAGEAMGLRSYHFTDDTPPFLPLGASVLYYRLKEVDWDGSYTFSEIVSVRVENAADGEPFVLLGNPVYDRLNFRIRDAHQGKVKVLLRNVSGQILYSVNQEVTQHGGDFSMALDNLPSGLYLAEISSEGARKVFRVVKK